MTIPGLPLAVIISLAVLMTRLFGGADVRAAGSGRIDGTVVNGTADGPTPADLPVTVHVFRDRSKTGELAARTDGSGHFTVEGLETGAAFVYFPVVEYAGVSYYPERPIILDGVQQQSVEIRVFEPTFGEQSLVFDRANLLVLGVDPAALTVMQMGAIVNESDRTIVPDRSDEAGYTARFPLPDGASQVTPQAGFSPHAVESVPGGIVRTDPIPPGRQELAFSYRIPLTGPTLDLALPLPYATRQFNLYVPDSGIAVASPALTFQGTAELSGQRYQLYSASGLPRNATVSIRLGGLPAARGLNAQQIGLVVIGASVAALAGGLLLAASRRRGPAGGSEPLASPRLAHDPAVQALADLDDRFERGEIDAESYRRLRSERKTLLVEQLIRSSG